MAKERPDDKRFKGVTSDPRFRRPSTKKTKTVLDKRFKHILTDERFKGTTSVDPRGIRTSTVALGKSKINEDLKKFYDIEEASEQGDSEGADHSPSVASGDEAGFKWDASSSSDDSESERVEEIDFDEDQSESEEVPLGDSSDKIAIMNCNWDHVTAADLFMLIQSFLAANAPGRKVTRVTIHKSDFGAERMDREEMYGPIIEGMPEDDDQDESLKSQEELKKLDAQRDAAIRKYERLKRMYFFAIAEFDSINSACIVYDELDGVSGGFISESLDMRFVPEDTPDPSSKRPPISEATKVPSGYSPPAVEVANLTMEHSKVTCTWDEDPADRKILMKKLTPAQIANLDLEAYLESASEDDEANAESLREALFGNSAEVEEGQVGDMEMRFSREVESVGKDVSKRLAETGKVDKNDVSEWQKYLEKRKEAKRAKKLERRQQIDSQKQERIANAKAAKETFKKARQEDMGRSSDDEEQPDSSEIAQDARLDKLFSDPKFAVDPTHPRFKKNSVVNELKRKHRK